MNCIILYSEHLVQTDRQTGVFVEGLMHTFSTPEDISSRYQKYAILSIAVSHTMTVFPPPCLHVLLCCHHDSSLKVTDGIYSIIEVIRR